MNNEARHLVEILIVRGNSIDAMPRQKRQGCGIIGQELVIPGNCRGFDEQFRRKWVYYLSYCEAGFLEGSIDVGIYQYRKPA